MDVVEIRTGVALGVEVTGSGPPVVLTHGWVIGSGMWERVAARLARRGHQVVAVDRRGCGRSSRPAAGYDLDTLADDLDGVLSALDLRDVTLVAHSVGGAEAVRMLSRYGASRVGRLVLVATTTPGPTSAEAPSPAQVAAVAEAQIADRPAYLRTGVPGFFGPDVSGPTADWAVGLARQASLTASIEIMRRAMTEDVSADVRACPVPTLLVHGDADVSAPLDARGRATADLLPDGRLEVYEGGPHGLPLTHAGRVADDVAAFALVGAAGPRCGV